MNMNAQTAPTASSMYSNPFGTLGTRMNVALNFAQARTPGEILAVHRQASNIASGYGMKPPVYISTGNMMAEHGAYLPAFIANVGSRFEGKLLEIVTADNPAKEFIAEDLHTVRWPNMTGAGLVTFETASEALTFIKDRSLDDFNRAIINTKTYPLGMDLFFDMGISACCAFIPLFLLSPLDSRLAWVASALTFIAAGYYFGIRNLKGNLVKNRADLAAIDNYRTLESELFAPALLEAINTEGLK